MAIQSTVQFITYDVDSAMHFDEFATHLSERGHEVRVYVSLQATAQFKMFQGEKIPFESIDEKAMEIAQKCKELGGVVITGVRHAFDIQMQNALKECAPDVYRLVYYDHLEAHVSETAAHVMLLANRVLFASANVLKMPFVAVLAPAAKREIGFYPKKDAEEIASRRVLEAESVRKAFFFQNDFEDTGQKFLVYLGGKSEAYFEEAFPAFIAMLNDEVLQSTIVILHIHEDVPGSAADQALFEEKAKQSKFAANFIISEVPREDVLVLASTIIYYETDMAPLFAFSEIPIIHVGHTPNEDILVANRLCSVATNPAEFARAIEDTSSVPLDYERVIHEKLGMRSDWSERLESAIIP